MAESPEGASERLEVLEMVERGLITPQEGVALLEALGRGPGFGPESGAESGLEADQSPAGGAGLSAGQGSGQWRLLPPRLIGTAGGRSRCG